MDIISIEEMNHIYWLGRYSERVYTTIREYFKGRNIMIEQPAFYITYCKNFTIPNCYKSSSDFLHQYAFDENNTDSILLELQKVLDHILAFWACIDDEIDSKQIRSVIKIGRHLERINLYLRLRKSKDFMMKPFHMLVARLRKGYVEYDKNELDRLGMNITGNTIDYLDGIKTSESIIKKKYRCII